MLRGARISQPSHLCPTLRGLGVWEYDLVGEADRHTSCSCEIPGIMQAPIRPSILFDILRLSFPGCQIRGYRRGCCCVWGIDPKAMDKYLPANANGGLMG